MNTQQLECFTTLAKTLNYAKAAARPFANYLGCELPDWCEKICAVKKPGST